MPPLPRKLHLDGKDRARQEETKVLFSGRSLSQKGASLCKPRLPLVELLSMIIPCSIREPGSGWRSSSA